MQIWYGWKDLVESFPTPFFFFFVILELRLNYSDFLKFSRIFSAFFGDDASDGLPT